LLSAEKFLAASSLIGPDAAVSLADLAWGSSLDGQLEELRGHSVLVATRDQLTAGLALIELDGIARRLVLCPPDLARERLPYIAETAGVDAVVSDETAHPPVIPGIGRFVTCSPSITRADSNRSESHQTEWILLTSGTTGMPKMALHTLSSLTGAIKRDKHLGGSVVWSTFYDIRRYGGLQIFLRALFDGASIVLSSAEESTGDFLTRAGGNSVTHISGTPSHWRRALMSPSAHTITPRYIRLSGEIVDQVILDSLKAFYPDASLVHAFASTEAGVGFDVRDGLAGFPASLIGIQGADVEMKVEDGSLRIRSAGTAAGYLGNPAETIAGGDGFIDTCDMVELRGDRYYFIGRRDGIINVGGLKVHPEEVEAVINRHPSVQMSLVSGRKNPITGALVVADVVVKSDSNQNGASGGIQRLKSDILETCRRTLAPYKVPTLVRFVPSLEVAPSGKLARLYRES
jgi:acyl-coenzyme A synthetase/AMP-(fatty) acid ligase